MEAVAMPGLGQADPENIARVINDHGERSQSAQGVDGRDAVERFAEVGGRGGGHGATRERLFLAKKRSGLRRASRQAWAAGVNP